MATDKITVKLLAADLSLALLNGLLSCRLICFPSIERYPNIDLILEHFSLISARENVRPDYIARGRISLVRFPLHPAFF